MTIRRRGIYLLPNLLTTSSLFFGLYAIILAMEQRFAEAAISVFVAMVLDGLDGQVARLTNTQSAFGVQYDSLSDMVSFGVAPALIVYQWCVPTLGKLGWLVAFVYAAMVALRLARFNTQASSEDKRFFQGLPSPSGAALATSSVWLFSGISTTDQLLPAISVLGLTFIAGILMVSNIRFHSIKQPNLKDRVPFMAILAIVLIYAFIAWKPPVILLLLSLIYITSGVVFTLIKVRRHRDKRHQDKI